MAIFDLIFLIGPFNAFFFSVLQVFYDVEEEKSFVASCYVWKQLQLL